jgi:hypothetical protein
VYIHRGCWGGMGIVVVVVVVVVAAVLRSRQYQPVDRSIGLDPNHSPPTNHPTIHLTATAAHRVEEQQQQPLTMGRWLNAVRGGASVAAEKKAAAGGKKKKAKAAAAAAAAAEAPAKVAKKEAKPAAVAPAEEEAGGAGGRTKTNKFIVDEAVNDDHSMVALSKETMQKLDIYQVRVFVCLFVCLFVFVCVFVCMYVCVLSEEKGSDRSIGLEAVPMAYKEGKEEPQSPTGQTPNPPKTHTRGTSCCSRGRSGRTRCAWPCPTRRSTGRTSA